MSFRHGFRCLRPGWLLAGLAVCASANADGMRCGSGLIRDGDPRSRVLELCGEPVDVERRQVLRQPLVYRHGRYFHAGPELLATEEEFWTYNFGPDAFMRRLRIVAGIVEEIETLGYGFHPR